MLKNMEENMNMMRIEMEDRKMILMKLPEVKKITVTETRNIINEIIGRPDTLEERISEPEEMSIKNIQNKAKEEKKTGKKKGHSISDL
jgi:hypothetical protein